MTSIDLISETEAAQLAGVSARTLLRFSESGYLTVQLTLDGSRSYFRQQIVEIFGAPVMSPTQASDPLSSPEQATNITNGDDCSELGEAQVVDSGQRAPESRIESESNTSSTPTVVESVPREEHRPQTVEQTEEISRLKNLISMQERMLDSKDDEIADLRNQRAWLRERIEKLEEKSDRDQILLLSETQTIRQLIAAHESKKTLVQQVLEWIGVNKSTEIATIPSNNDYSRNKSTGGGSRTIEVEKAANQ